MSWEDILKKDADWKREMENDADVAEGNIMDRKEKGGDVVIYEGRGGRDGNPAEMIKEEDPKLYQKLESHFSANPLTENMKGWVMEDGKERGVTFHWKDAFLKYGMDDGYYRELSEEVTDFIESLGYTVRMTHAITHNVYINQVMWTDKVKL